MTLSSKEKKFVTSLGVIKFGEELYVSIPEAKRNFKISMDENGAISQGVSVNGVLRLQPFGIEKSVRGDFFFLYVVDLEDESMISFKGRKGVIGIRRALNKLCEGIFSKEGMEAKALSVNELTSNERLSRLNELNLKGSYWLASIFFRETKDGNRISSIYYLENNEVKSIDMYDELGRIKPKVITKKVLAFVRIKIDIEKTKKLWRSC